MRDTGHSCLHDDKQVILPESVSSRSKEDELLDDVRESGQLLLVESAIFFCSAQS